MKYETTITAPEKLRNLTLDQLLNAFESTEYLHTPEVPTVRGWLMDEIESRNEAGFSAWLDLAAPEDKDLRRYVTVNPICIDCKRFGADCAGTTNTVWTGCIYRQK